MDFYEELELGIPKNKKMIWRSMNKISGTGQCVSYTCVEISHQILLRYKTAYWQKLKVKVNRMWVVVAEMLATNKIINYLSQLWSNSATASIHQ